MGIKKPSVLPVPVCAVASTSRPSRAGGMQPACTGVGVTNLLASSRAIKAGERENSENCVVKIKSFPIGLRSRRHCLRPAIGTGHGGAHTHSGARACFLNMRKGEPKVESKTSQTFKGRMPKARSCHTLLHRQSAPCRPAPRSHAFCVPWFACAASSFKKKRA